MSAVSLRLAAALAVYGGFALFQAVGRDQPLAHAARVHGARIPAAIRTLSLASLALPCAILAWDLGWAAAALVLTGLLSLVATAFVLLAPVVPRLIWGTALASPFLVVGLVIDAWVLA